MIKIVDAILIEFYPLVVTICAVSVAIIVGCFFFCLFYGYSCSNRTGVNDEQDTIVRNQIPLRAQHHSPQNGLVIPAGNAVFSPVFVRTEPSSARRGYLSSYTVTKDVPEVTEEYVKLERECGTGVSAIVFVATLGRFGSSFKVAVKKVKKNNTKNRRLLINEGQLMATLSPHVNILQLLAFLKDRQGRRHLVLEYCALGSLETLLPRLTVTDEASSFIPTTTDEKHMISVNHMYVLAYQIADAMTHLTKECCHRDLSVRNVILTDNFLVKIGDFGLAKKVTRAYFSSRWTSLLPPETAPEASREGVFTEQSDVYNFGLLLIFLFNLSNHKEIIDLARLDPHKIAKPIYADDEIFETVLRCLAEARNRPTFAELFHIFQCRVPPNFLERLKQEKERNQCAIRSIQYFLKSIPH